MRIQSTITDLTAEQFQQIDRMLLTEYDLTRARITVCAVFQHAELERHVEMPLGVFAGTLMSLQIQSIPEALDLALSMPAPAARD